MIDIKALISIQVIAFVSVCFIGFILRLGALGFLVLGCYKGKGFFFLYFVLPFFH